MEKERRRGGYGQNDQRERVGGLRCEKEIEEGVFGKTPFLLPPLASKQGREREGRPVGRRRPRAWRRPGRVE